MKRPNNEVDPVGRSTTGVEGREVHSGQRDVTGGRTKGCDWVSAIQHSTRVRLIYKELVF